MVSEVALGGGRLTSPAFTSQNGRGRLSDRPSMFKKGDGYQNAKLVVYPAVSSGDYLWLRCWLDWTKDRKRVGWTDLGEQMRARERLLQTYSSYWQLSRGNVGRLSCQASVAKGAGCLRNHYEGVVRIASGVPSNKEGSLDIQELNTQYLVAK